MNYRTVITYIDENAEVIKEPNWTRYIIVKKIKEKVLKNNAFITIYYTYIIKLSNQLNLFT